ncbi:unnamed protein product [Rotaria socialis]|uniref:Uncharacterized protein n=2 Tax=Rotaria socialis TaxID=392032 RepID=A0A817PJU7_9BILA|nr:unnamed protein product [Rotaria socialis]
MMYQCHRSTISIHYYTFQRISLPPENEKNKLIIVIGPSCPLFLVTYGNEASPEQQTTLLRKAGDQAGRILEGGADVVIAPAKCLAHMQENWLTYIVCATILMVGILFIYCCIRRKISSRFMPSPAGSTLSKMIRDEAIKIVTFHRGIQNI